MSKSKTMESLNKKEITDYVLMMVGAPVLKVDETVVRCINWAIEQAEYYGVKESLQKEFVMEQVSLHISIGDTCVVAEYWGECEE